jgi:hypothetical protein
MQAQAIGFNEGALVDLIGVPGVAQDVGAQGGEFGIESIVRELARAEVLGWVGGHRAAQRLK